MVSNLAKLKWLLLFSLLPLSCYAADSSGFAIQLKGPGALEISEQAKYGPISGADTLWSIAKDHRPSTSLSIYKTMAAIQALNPSAFLNNDINRMIDGSFLLLPSAEQIKQADATALIRKLNKPVKKVTPSVTAAPTTPVAASTKKVPAKAEVAAAPDTTKVIASAAPASTTVDMRVQDTKLSELQNELTTANEQLLLSSETNRRLKLQLAAIRAELEGLKQDVEADNQLNAELKALVEQQQTQIVQQQAKMTEAENSSLFGELSFTNTTLIIAVVGLFVLLILVWLGLWLKNRNDQKQNDGSSDSAIFETDNAVDELSEYLTVENYAAAEHSADNMSAFDDEISMRADDGLDVVISNDDPDLNLSALDDSEFESNFLSAELSAAVTAEPIAGVSPDTTEKKPNGDAGKVTETATQQPLDEMPPETSFSDLDVTLDDVSTSFDDDEVHPDLSWRNELDEETPVVDAEVNDEPSLIPETAQAAVLTEDDDDAADLSDIEAMLAEYNPELANTGSEADDTATQQGQTVDEMLAQLEQSESTDAELSAIDAVLSEFSPNAFNEAPAEQAPVDVEAAKEEEFIDIDKLLSDVATEPSAVEEEPYDKVSLDVGLDEYSNQEAMQRDAAEDEEANTIGAKLDLARAYLEIDDKEGAKSILEQLTSVGSAAQQAEVSKLLGRL